MGQAKRQLNQYNRTAFNVLKTIGNIFRIRASEGVYAWHDFEIFSYKKRNKNTLTELIGSEQCVWRARHWPPDVQVDGHRIN